MQNIKFRQRNLNNSLYYYWGLVDGIWQNPKIQDNYIHPMDSEQYTGLKDKNGVEIYEADRVSFIKTYNNKRYVGEVRYVKEVVGYMLCAMNNEPWHSFEFGLGTVGLEILEERTMESENNKQSRYDEYERREYEEWTEREEDKQSLGPVLRAAPLVHWSKEKYLQSIKKIKDWGGDARTSQH